VTPETPGSIRQGGELGYSLSHAYGMAFDNPDPSFFGERIAPYGYSPPGLIGGWKARPVSQGKKIHVSCDTSVMKVSTIGRPIGLA
jgi:hypothetical protein